MGKRDFLAITDLSATEVTEVLDLAVSMKAGSYSGKPLSGKTLGMIFSKSSTRTRVSFEVGVHQLGGQALFLSSRDIQLGRGEPVRDTARVLSRYVHGIMIRTFAQDEVTQLAHYATVPVINGLTDLLHPCQILADLMTLREAHGTWDGIVVAWVGDGNNMANSWLNAAGLLGFELRLCCPKEFGPDPAILDYNAQRAAIHVVDSASDAVKGAHVVTTDVWASMGQEDEVERRREAFRGFRVDEALMATSHPDAIFLHCLPAHRGEEVTEGVLEGAQSRVWDEAENRLHAQKALLVLLMGENRDNDHD